MDNRNYMVWGYRLDLMDLCKVNCKKTKDEEKWKEFLENEIAWVEEQIKKDLRNNSAWNFRFNIVKELKMSFEQDFEYVTKQVEARVTNEAAWNYFNGLLRIHHEEDPESK